MAVSDEQLKRRLLFAAALSSLLTAHAGAQITVLSQDRSVSADARLSCVDIGYVSSQATGTAGVFSEMVAERMTGAEANENGGLCIEPGDVVESRSSQNTNIAGISIEGMGSAAAGKGGALESGSATGRSALWVRFQVASEMPYQLFGEVDGLEAVPGLFLPGQATVSLKQGDTIFHTVSPHAPDLAGEGTKHSFSFSGVLAPGEYTLDALASASAFGPTESGSTSSFRLTFVPEPALTPHALLVIAACGFRFRRPK
jgi:hypothetical protein